MLRRLPPIVSFIFICLIGIVAGSVVGLVNEFGQQPFSAANALVWLFILIVSGGIVTVIALYGRNRLG